HEILPEEEEEVCPPFGTKEPLVTFRRECAFERNEEQDQKQQAKPAREDHARDDHVPGSCAGDWTSMEDFELGAMIRGFWGAGGPIVSDCCAGWGKSVGRNTGVDLVEEMTSSSARYSPSSFS